MDARCKFFFGLERKNGQSCYVHCLRSENGEERTQLSEIRQRAVRFYNELYRSEYREDEVMSAGFYTGLPQILKKLVAELEKSLCERELYNALWDM